MIKNRPNNNPSKAWISQGLESLINRGKDTTEDFIIIGSGYGGAIAAEALAGATKKNGDPVSVYVLERGKEFTAGTFPSSLAETPTEIRFTTQNAKRARGTLDGLYDVRLGNDLNVVLANGLGGGSLINAGVMERPSADVFSNSWPEQFRNFEQSDFYNKVIEKLGGTVNKQDNNITLHPSHQKEPLAKFKAIKSLAGNANFRPANISIAMKGRKNWAGVELKQCNLCGDCASGCNVGAKDSLNNNLLYAAKEKGANLITGATVLSIEKKEHNEWQLNIVHTDENLRKDQIKPFTIRAKQIILSAGSLGSTELLKKSSTLEFSDKLGERFSSNGDAIITAYNQKSKSNAIASESVKPYERNVGPTITGIIDNRKGAKGKKFVVQEMAVPAMLEVLFSELYTTSYAMRSLYQSPDKSRHFSNYLKMRDPLAVDSMAIDNTSIYAVMGNDNANGKLTLDKSADEYYGEGTIQVDWEELKNSDYLEQQIDYIKELSSQTNSGAEIIVNPAWKAFPDAAMFLVDERKGPPITVHPLGGCSMADSAENGVVNHLGKVFDKDKGKSVHEGLFVLDGSIIPTAIGTNPALTIAAVTQRAIDLLINEWQLEYNALRSRNPTPLKTHRNQIDHSDKQLDTQIQIVERLSNQLKIKNAKGELQNVVMEISLNSHDKSLKELAGKGVGLNNNKITINPNASNPVSGDLLSKLRIFDRDEWNNIRSELSMSTDNSKYVKSIEEKLDDIALFIAPLSGDLTVFGRESSSYYGRLFRGLWAWFANRGARDILHELDPTDYEKAGRRPDYKRRSVKQLWKDAKALASRAGEVRTLKYDLNVEAVTDYPEFSNLSKQKIIGIKRFTYSRRANPWRQLSEMTLTKFSPWVPQSNKPTVLTLDTQYLARIGVPLIKLVKQRDGVAALADIAGFAAYFLRLLMHIHIWSFRQPDMPKPRKTNLLAGEIEGISKPIVFPLIKVDTIKGNDVSGYKDGEPVYIRLICYKQKRPIQNPRPILMIHGYSVSSNSFAHPSVKNGLAEYFYDKDKRDVWLVDLRTSSGLKTARYPWKFEDVAEKDIEEAVDFIYEHYQEECEGKHKIDVLAHCMGTVMFSMAVLNSQKINPESERDDKDPKFYKKRIRRVVFSQVTPALKLSPDNQLRALLANYFKELLPDDYQFNPYLSETIDEENTLHRTSLQRGKKDVPNTYKPLGIVEQLLDRLLYTLPYPENEFDRINPFPFNMSKRVTYAQTRHRMDAIYGRDFNLVQLTDDVAEHIDDLFGPMSIETVTQVMHFANLQMATTVHGYNLYVTKQNLWNKWRDFPTLSIHSKANGLVDYSTGNRCETIFKEASCKFTTVLIDDHTYGHQDGIIGKNAHKDVFEKVQCFLNAPISPIVESKEERLEWRLEAPHAGPIIIPPEGIIHGIGSSVLINNGYLRIMVGADEALGLPFKPLFIPVEVSENNHLKPSQGAIDKALDLFFKDHQSKMDKETLWITTDVPKTELTVESDNAGVLVLLAYDQLFSIGNSLIQSPRDVHDVSEPVEPYSISIAQIQGDPNNQPKWFQQIFTDHGQVEQNLRNLLRPMIDNFFNQKTQNSLLKNGLIQIPKQQTREISTSFVFGSCQYGHGLIDKELAYESYSKLGSFLDKTSVNPDFGLLIGDQVYTDPTAGIVDPRLKYDRYDRPYRRLYESNPFKSVSRRLPLLTMLDDHELKDNWQPCSSGANNEAKEQRKKEFNFGMKSFFKYQRGLHLEEVNSQTVQQRWYKFTQNEVPFFMVDSRSERQPRTATSLNDESTTLICNSQMNALEDFLFEHKGVTKFVISPSVVLPRHKHCYASNEIHNCLHSDGWDGYPSSLYRLLSFIVDNEIKNLVFLSGDEHISFDTEIVLTNKKTNKKVKVRSIHCSGLYAPYPFANSNKHDLLGDDEFNFGDYSCKVRTVFAKENSGFASITVATDGSVQGPVYINHIF